MWKFNVVTLKFVFVDFLLVVSILDKSLYVFPSMNNARDTNYFIKILINC